MNPKTRLNLFALPSQTTLIFAGILIVIGLPLLLSLTGRFALLLPLMPLVVLLFTLWDFLAEPVRIKRRYAAQPLMGEDGAWLTRWVEVISRRVGLQPPPILLQTSRPLDMPFAFGTWRQRYLIFPTWLIAELRRVSATNPQQTRFAAVLLHHELAHFANHDVALTGFARSLLRQTIWVSLAWWFASLWTPIIYRWGAHYLPEMAAGGSSALPALLLSALLPVLPSDYQELLSQVMNSPPQMTWDMMVISWLELTMAVLPLIGGAVFLWLRDWNLLLRVRELYADARVDGWLGQIAPLIADTQRWLRVSSFTARQASAQDAATPRRRLFGLRPVRMPTLSWPGATVGNILHPNPQPKGNRRELVLAQPQQAYGTVAEIGRRAGVIVLLLFLIMTSLLAPAQKGIGSEIGIGIGFLILATGLTPSAIVHLPDLHAARRDRRRAIGFYMLVFNSVLLVALMLALFGVLLRPNDLNLVMVTAAGALPAHVPTVVADPLWYMAQAVLGSLLVYFVAAPLLLYGFLTLDFRLKQRVLHWYAAPWLAERSARVFLLISLALTAVLWLGVSPLLNLAAFPGIISADWELAVGVAAALLCAAGLADWLRRGDRRYRNRCPHCDCSVEVSFHLGLACPHCGERLQPWLVARE